MKPLHAYLLVALGGALGAMARLAVANASRRVLGESFPWGTFIINISGSFALGIVATIALHHALPNSEALRMAIGVGFLGAYTTFSTYELEGCNLLTEGRWMTAAIYMVGSVLAGLAAVRLGIQISRGWGT